MKRTSKRSVVAFRGKKILWLTQEPRVINTSINKNRGLRTLLVALLAVIGISFTACKKNSGSSGNTITQPQLQYQLTATNVNYGVARTTSAAQLQWTSGLANPDIVIFTAKQGNLQVQYKSTNNNQIDLVSSVASDFGALTLPAGTYDQINLKIYLDHDGSEPALQLNGQVTDSLEAIPVEILINEQVELQTEESNVTISGDSSYVAATTIDLSQVAAGITADMLLNAHLTDGTIVISSGSNVALYAIILSNLRNGHYHCGFFHFHH